MTRTGAPPRPHRMAPPLPVTGGRRTGEQSRARYPDHEGDVVVDGVRTHFEVYGTGEPTILLLPTWSIIHSRHWKMQIPYLARYFRVVTFDGRGNGKSDRPTDTEAYSEWAFAADALAVLDATTTARAVIVALSLGAQRGLILATDHPERVEGAVFIGPAYPGGGEPLVDRMGYSWDDEPASDEGWAKYNRHVWLRDYEGFLDFFFSRMFTEPHSTKPIEDCVGWGLETSGEMLVTAQTAATLGKDEARELAGRVRCPVLVIQGTDDGILSPTRGYALAEHTGGELLVIDGAGHGPHVRDPIRINLAIRDFVRALPKSPR